MCKVFFCLALKRLYPRNTSPVFVLMFSKLREPLFGQMVLVPNAFGIAETKGQKMPRVLQLEFF
jgi:hypothetical protein